MCAIRREIDAIVLLPKLREKERERERVADVAT
jgi:hypothetical protein